jgi:hypothetical protein
MYACVSVWCIDVNVYAYVYVCIYVRNDTCVHTFMDVRVNGRYVL